MAVIEGKPSLSGARVLILKGESRGSEGVCLGLEQSGRAWAVSPDGSDEILSLLFEDDFSLLIDLSAPAGLN
jgi:hypothetical protein